MNVLITLTKTTTTLKIYTVKLFTILLVMYLYPLLIALVLEH